MAKKYYTPEELAHRAELMKRVKDIIRDFGVWNVDCDKLSKDWGIPLKTIYNWRDKAEGELGQVDIRSVGSSVKSQMESNLRIAHAAVRKAALVVNGGGCRAEDLRTFAVVLKAYNDTVDRHTEFAERWGYKAVVAKRVELGVGESESERLARIVQGLE